MVKMWSIIFFNMLCLLCVKAMTDEEMKAEFTRFVMGCVKTNPVEPSDLIDLQKMVVPKKKEVKCLLACAYKAEGSMNPKGLYDIEHAYRVAELAKNGDEKRLENAKKMADLCSKVNEAKVSDEEKGCDRAAMIFKCVAENAKKFGFEV